ncbi:MAG: 1-phosphofructokinase [Vulcanimicrobiaceae bacterium]
MRRATPVTTVTLNPAVDEAVSLAVFVPGATNRCDLDALDAGGKGVNASRVIRRLGRQTIAYGFVGGVTGQMLRERLDSEDVLHAFDDVDEMTRLNVMIYERESGRRSRVYLPGARVEADKIAGLQTRLEQIPRGSLVVLAGSVPPGLPVTVYRDLVRWFDERGVRSIVDTSGDALAAVLEARPFLIKPNVEEAQELLGCTLGADDDVARAARDLRARGVENVVISQGAQGAIGAGPDGTWKAITPSVVARSTVGSGDSMVAGLAIAFNEDSGLREGLRLGTAAGAATATVPGTHLCNAQDVQRLLQDVVLQAVS